MISKRTFDYNRFILLFLFAVFLAGCNIIYSTANKQVDVVDPVISESFEQPIDDIVVVTPFAPDVYITPDMFTFTPGSLTDSEYDAIINELSNIPVKKHKYPKNYVVDKSVELIKSFEGFSNTAYRCPSGVLSIGYGFNKKLFKHNKIGKREATRQLTKLVKDIHKFIDKTVVVELSYGQKIALTSFIYNVGITAFYNSTMRMYINTNNMELASHEFPKWCKYTKRGHKKKSSNLKARRYSERLVFDADYDTLHLQLEELT